MDDLRIAARDRQSQLNVEEATLAIDRLARRSLGVRMQDDPPVVTPEISAASESEVLDPPAQEQVRSYIQSLHERGMVRGLFNVGPETQYQVAALDSFVEFEVGIPGGKSVIADGIDPDTGFLQDAKFASDERSWYDPPSMQSDFMTRLATEDLERRLLAYKAVIESSLNPFRGLEIVTTDSASAEFFDSVMLNLGVPGRVRIE